MAEKSVPNSQKSVNPMFFIPEEATGMYYAESTTETVEEEPQEDFYITDDASAEYYEAPATPDIIGIVEQKIRTSATGNQVVDLIIEVEDIPGVSKYDFRVTKL